jgi:hypothetical protein
LASSFRALGTPWHPSMECWEEVSWLAVLVVVRVLLHSRTGGKHWVALTTRLSQGSKC